MNTPAHLLVALALLSKRKQQKRNIAVVVGALLPDFSIFVFYFNAKLIEGLAEREIWREAYWTEPWQTISAISNSVPLALIVFAVGVWRKSVLVSVFALALLIHFALDFPLHADDAHRHFWPLTDWRFFSPLSYWNSDHGGGIGAGIEIIAISIASLILWRRFATWSVRLAITITAILYFAAGLYFSFAFS